MFKINLDPKLDRSNLKWSRNAPRLAAVSDCSLRSIDLTVLVILREPGLFQSSSPVSREFEPESDWLLRSGPSSGPDNNHAIMYWFTLFASYFHSLKNMFTDFSPLTTLASSS